MKRFTFATTLLLLPAILVWASTDDASAKGKTWRISSCAASAQKSKCRACVDDGNNWIEGQGCLSKACLNGNRAYEGGDTIHSGGRWYMCNGLTGNWEQFASTTPPPPPKKRTRPVPGPDPTAPATPR
jgi:hypothetical protein